MIGSLRGVVIERALEGTVLIEVGGVGYQVVVSPRVLAERRIYSVEPDLSQEELLLLAGRVSDTDLAPFFRRLAGLRDWDWRRLPEPSPRPALVVQGEREGAVTPRDVLRAWERLSGRPVAVIPGTHMPYLSFPQEFNESVEAFLGAPGAAGIPA